MNKKGQSYSPGFSIIVGIALIVLGALAWVVLNQVLTQYITPTFETLTNQSIGIAGFNESQAEEVIASNNRFNFWWTGSLALFFVIVLVYWFVNAISGSKVEPQ